MKDQEDLELNLARTTASLVQRKEWEWTKTRSTPFYFLENEKTVSDAVFQGHVFRTFITPD